jgi:hypothetical protein
MMQFFYRAGLKSPGLDVLERFKKYCSHSVRKNKAAVFLGFGFVSAQLQGFSTCAFAKASPKHQKSSPRMATVFFKPL